MDYRLVVAGFNVVLASAAVIAYGVLAGAPQAVGAGLGGVIAGSTIAALGLAASPGPSAGLSWYAGVLARFLGLTLGDANVADHPARAAPTTRGTIIYWSPRVIPPEKLVPGAGRFEDAPYVALPPARLLEAGEDPAEALSVRLGLASRVTLDSSGDVVVFEYEGVPREAAGLAESPTGPYALLTLYSVAESSERQVELVEVESEEDRVRVVVRLAG